MENGTGDRAKKTDTLNFEVKSMGIRLRTGIIWFVILVALLVPSIIHRDLYADEKQGTLNMAFLPNLSQVEILNTFSSFIHMLEKELGMNVNVVSGKDYQATIELLRDRKVDIAMLGAFPLFAARKEFDVAVFVRNVELFKKGEPPREAYHSVIVTRKDSGIDSLSEAKGKSISFTDPKSSSGFLFPLVGFMKQGVDLQDFSRVIYVKKHPNSLVAVFNGVVDVAALSEDIFLRGTGVDLAQLKVLWKSEPIKHGPWVARADFPKEKLIRIKEAFLRISKSSEAGEIFKNTYIKGFVPATISDYENVHEVIRLKESLERRDLSNGEE